jgi:hypothetical protein
VIVPNNVGQLPSGRPGDRHVPPSANGVKADPVTIPPKDAALVINDKSAKIDVTMHSPMNIVDIINGLRLTGVTASLDRYGRVILVGDPKIGGNADLRAFLGY